MDYSVYSLFVIPLLVFNIRNVSRHSNVQDAMQNISHSLKTFIWLGN